MRTCTAGGEGVSDLSQQAASGRRGKSQMVCVCLGGKGGGAPIHADAQAADAVVVAGEDSHLLTRERIPHICGGSGQG